MPNIVDPTIPNFPPQGIQAQLDLLYLYNPDVAQELIDQLNAGIIKMEELEKELKKALQDLQGILRYKGSVETEADLPTEGNVIGDVWNITSTDENVAWNGTSWDKFGSGIDVSVFLTKTDAANTYLPLSGGTLTGVLGAQSEVYRLGAQTVLKLYGISPEGKRDTASADIGVKYGTVSLGTETRLYLPGTTITDVLLCKKASLSETHIGSRFDPWGKIYVNKMNNGSDLNVPTEGGTLARLEDIPTVEVSSVNGKKGAVVLTGQDINSTLTGTGDPVTTTVTEHLQTLKNDETELGNQVSNIQALIPSDASETNLLATKADITGGVSEVFHDDSLSGKGTESEPLSVARPAAIIREW